MFHLFQERLFVIGMWWRIVYGILRVVFSLALLKVVGTPLLDVAKTLMSHEMVEDPSDILYMFITNILSNHPLYVTYFLAFYFLFWGIVDIIISINLLKHKLWAFPVSMVLIGLFFAYEIVRLIHTHSIVLLTMMTIDSYIFWLIWREYKKLQLPKTQDM